MIKIWAWISNNGIIYGIGSKHGNRVKHVLEHLRIDTSKPIHTVFNVKRNELIGLIDEAWIRRADIFSSRNNNNSYVINMHRVIGTNGETKIEIVVKANTSEIITAYPKK